MLKLTNTHTTTLELINHEYRDDTFYYHIVERMDDSEPVWDVYISSFNNRNIYFPVAEYYKSQTSFTELLQILEHDSDSNIEYLYGQNEMLKMGIELHWEMIKNKDSESEEE